MKFLKKVLAGPVIDIKTGKETKTDFAEHGFDLGDLNHPSDWKLIQKSLGLSDKPEHKDQSYHWKGPGILIVTGNDPVSGELGEPGRRAPEKGYLSYVGIEGKPDKVKKAVELLKKHASFKDESVGKRSFI